MSINQGPQIKPGLLPPIFIYEVKLDGHTWSQPLLSLLPVAALGKAEELQQRSCGPQSLKYLLSFPINLLWKDVLAPVLKH